MGHHLASLDMPWLCRSRGSPFGFSFYAMIVQIMWLTIWLRLLCRDCADHVAHNLTSLTMPWLCRSHGSPFGFTYYAVIVQITWLTIWLHLLCRDCPDHCQLSESLFCINFYTQEVLQTHSTMQEQYFMVFKLYSDELKMACILILLCLHYSLLGWDAIFRAIILLPW
jgi:hypothetical protein